MKSTILDARTVSIVKELTTEKRHGANGEFESTEILFRIAVDRDYKTTRVENGKTISEYPTDFFLAKATGKVAEVFANNCTTKREDGKLASRHLLLLGNFETYQKPRRIEDTFQVNYNGQLLNINFSKDYPDTSVIFMVSEIKFLDKKPENQTAPASNGVASVTPASVMPAQAQVPVSQEAVTPAVQNVAVQAPIAPAVAQTVAPVQEVAVAQPAMNPPVVDPNFVPAGTTAPF